MDGQKFGSRLVRQPTRGTLCRSKRTKREPRDVALLYRDNFARTQTESCITQGDDLMNIGSLLPRHARYRSDHTAIVFNDTRFTFQEFNCRVNRLANALLDLGLSKGDKI